MNPLYIEIIDRSVYSKEREMRLFLCNKNPNELRLLNWNDNNIKKMNFKDYSRCFISYINKDLPIRVIETIYRDNPKTALKTQLEIKQIEQKKKEFQQKIKEKPIIEKEIIFTKSSHKQQINDKGYQYVYELVDNLPDYRSYNYEDWIQVLWALKNQSLIDGTDYFEIFNEFSKKTSQKYDATEVKDVWNSTEKRNNKGLTIGTIIYMLMKDNPEAFKYILKKYKKIDPETIINNFYNPNPKNYFENIIEYENERTSNFIIKNGQKGCFIQIEMGMGKTETLFKQLDEHNQAIYILTKEVNGNDKMFLNYPKQYKRILVISHRRTIAGKFYGDLQKMNFKLYFDYKDKSKIDANRLIVQLDSLYKVDLNQYDLIILDECESLFSHLKYKQMRHRDDNISVLEHHIKTASRVILMDANMSIKSFEIMKQIDDLKKYTFIRNNYKKLKGWEMNFINGEQQTDLIKENIKKNEKVCVASLSKSLVDSHYSKIIPNPLIYSADTDNEEKFKGVMKVNESWKDKSVIYTPSISAGVSCTIENQYKNIYGYCNNQSALATDFLQMLRRVRHPIEKSFYIWNEYINYYSNLLSIQDIENYIKYSHIISDCNSLIQDIPKFIQDNQFVPVKNTAYYIFIYNILEEEINRCLFKQVLVNLSIQKGIKIEISEDSNKSNMKLKNSVAEVKKEIKEQMIDKIVKCEVISKEEYDNITTMMIKEEKLTEEQQYQHKLKTLLNRFKYDTKKYNQLNENDKNELVRFMMDEDNYKIYVNNSFINGDNVEESINKMKQSDSDRKDTTEAHNYKQYHRMHFLINEMIKIIGFSSIKDNKKILKDEIDKNMENKNEELIKVINEINFINKIKKKESITLKVIGTIIGNFYGYKFKRGNTTLKGKKFDNYCIINHIEWGTSYYPNLKVINKTDFSELL